MLIQKVRFSAISAVWVKDEAGYLKPTSPHVHPLGAQTYHEAEKEVQELTDQLRKNGNRRIWAFGETKEVKKNCGVK